MAEMNFFCLVEPLLAQLAKVVLSKSTDIEKRVTAPASLIGQNLYDLYWAPSFSLWTASLQVFTITHQDIIQEWSSGELLLKQMKTLTLTPKEDGFKSNSRTCSKVSIELCPVLEFSFSLSAWIMLLFIRLLYHFNSCPSYLWNAPILPRFDSMCQLLLLLSSLITLNYSPFM